MTEPVMASAAVVGVGGVLGGNVPCRKCGYNLRGLGVEGRCPECGTPVGLSVSGDLLRYSDPEWLEGLGRGVSLIIWGVVAMILGMIVGAVMSRSDGTVRGLLGLAAQGIMLAGWWSLTRPDPSGIGEDRYGTSRQLIRVGLVGGMVAALTQLIGERSGGLVAGLAWGLSVLGQIVALVGMFAQLQYLKKLAVRIPDDGLARRAGFLMYAMGISYGVLLLSGLVLVLVARVTTPGSGAFMGLGCAAAIAGLALLVFSIMYLLMVEKFGKRFKEQARLAREAWGQRGVEGAGA